MIDILASMFVREVNKINIRGFNVSAMSTNSEQNQHIILLEWTDLQGSCIKLGE